MALITFRTYFLLLSYLAIFVLWGLSLWNGTVKALILASWRGNFEDGTPFHTSYTGLIILDFPISLLVAFFYFGTNGHNQAYQHFLIDAYSTLQSAFIWLYVESGRGLEKPSTVANPIVWGLVWQCFGAAISLPLYFLNHLSWLREKPVELAPVPLSIARSIPLSFSIGALFPAVVGMLPTWIDRSPRSHQSILAAWQPDPIWVSVVQAVAVLFFDSFGSAKATKEAEESHFWIRFSYLLAAASSAIGHLYVLYQMITSSDPEMTVTRMYVPKTFTGIYGDLKLMDGPWLFLQYDLIIITLSSLSWAYILASRLSLGKVARNFSLLLQLLMGSLILGPGATVSLTLFWREGELQRKRASLSANSKSRKS